MTSLTPVECERVRRALERGSRYTLTEILDGLITGDFQRWTVEDATLITAVQTDTVRFCLLLALGGRSPLNWLNRLPVVEAWAIEHHCMEMRIYGRKGWSRLLNYEITGRHGKDYVMRKRL